MRRDRPLHPHGVLRDHKVTPGVVLGSHQGGLYYHIGIDSPNSMFFQTWFRQYINLPEVTIRKM